MNRIAKERLGHARSKCGSAGASPSRRIILQAAQGRSTRRGAFTVVVLMCLLVAGLLLASLLKLALLENRQTGYEQYRLQATWLVVSGFDRAASRLTLEPEYAGETWDVEPAQLGGAEAATVNIRVEQPDSGSRRRTIVVEAVYPVADPHHVRLTRQASVTIPGES